MQENKYFYEGIPLSTYCKDKEMNISTIRARIWKKRNNKKYEKYTDQEIVNLVVNTYKTNIKYMYKGMTLRQYCIKKEINYETIFNRIDNLKKENKNLTNDELVILAMEEFENKNFRFFYKGIPLKEYIKSHPEINYNTIRTYINVEKEKNTQLTDEELIKQYIEKEHKGIYTYYYLGIPLKKYCEENNLNYKNIIAYIGYHRNDASLKDLNNDELVEVIIQMYQPFKPKYLYKGTTLSAYCKENNLSYYSVISFVKSHIAKGSTKSLNDLIEEGINTINRYGIIYYYAGIPLKDYAKENNLNVSSIRAAILKKKANSNKPLQEIVNECVEAYQRFTIKYSYEGESLSSFCKKIGLSYYTVLSKYLRDYKDTEEISIDEGISKTVKYFIENPPEKTKYFYEGELLCEYCRKINLSYHTVISRYKKEYKDKPEVSVEDALKQIIKYYEDHPPKDSKYFYDGDFLANYCRKTGLSYHTVISKYIKDYANKPEISVEDALKQIIKYYEEHPPIKTKFYYENQTLSKFCNTNGYSYQSILSRTNTKLKKGIEYETAVENSLKEYDEKLEIKRIVSTFEKVNNNQSKDLKEWKDICQFLKIDFENVLDLVNMDFSCCQAINLIWFFSDNKNSNELKTISDKKIESLFRTIENLKKSKESDLVSFKLYDLIGIYKSKLYDTRGEILISKQRYIIHVIRSLSRKYNIDLNKNNFEDFESEIKLYLLKAISHICLNTEGQVIKYMDLTVKGYFRSFLKKYKSQTHNASLNDSKFSKDRNKKNTTTKIEDLVAPNEMFSDSLDSSFSEEIAQALSCLSEEDFLFVHLRFQENYSDFELAEYFDINIKEVKTRESTILSLLKDTPKLQALNSKIRK